jgi:tRNA(Met) C34 N-acetyltransferase TmcA
MGYGGRTMELLLRHLRGESLGGSVAGGEDEEEDDEEEDADAEEEEAEEEEHEEDEEEEHEEDGEGEARRARQAASRKLRREKVGPRAKLPPLLVPVDQRPAPRLHWCGVSFGVTPLLLNFWLRLGFELCYLRQVFMGGVGEGGYRRWCGLLKGS